MKHCACGRELHALYYNEDGKTENCLTCKLIIQKHTEKIQQLTRENDLQRFTNARLVNKYTALLAQHITLLSAAKKMNEILQKITVFRNSSNAERHDAMLAFVTALQNKNKHFDEFSLSDADIDQFISSTEANAIVYTKEIHCLADLDWQPFDPPTN